MKKLLLFVFLLTALASSAQYIRPGYSPKVQAYGNWFNRLAADSAMHIPYKQTLTTNDRDTTPQLFVYVDTLRGFWGGVFHNIGFGGGGGGSYTADEISLHLAGSVFSINNSWTGSTSITTVGPITAGTWQSTPVADPYIASSAIWNLKQTSALPSAQMWVGNGSGVAAPLTITGDWSISNVGVASLTNVVTAGNCSSCNITYDAKGRITVAANGTPGAAPFPDNAAIIKNNADNTRLLKFSAASVPTATTVTWTFPGVNGTVARIDAAQTFTGVQSFTSNPIFNTTSTVGYVWTATGTGGQGAWAASSGGGGISALTGDVTASGTGSVATTLATVNSTVGAFGDGVHIPTFTVNGKGLITAAGSVYIDSTKFLTVSAFNLSTTTFTVRTPGAGTGAIPTAYTNAGALVVPKWAVGIGMTSYTVAADSLISPNVDTNFISTKNWTMAQIAAFGGGGTGSGALSHMTTVPNSANYTATFDGMFILTDLTSAANHTFTFPSAVQKNFFVIKNNSKASSGFIWSAAGRSIYDAQNNLVTSFESETDYIVADDGVNLNVISKYSNSVGSIGWVESVAPNTANYTVPAGRRTLVTLTDLSGQANRNVALQAAPSAGDEVILDQLNASGSGFVWSFTNAIVKDWGGNTISALTPSTTYHLIWISGSSYYKIVN